MTDFEIIVSVIAIAFARAVADDDMDDGPGWL